MNTLLNDMKVLKCPQCGYPQYCGCTSCASVRTKPGAVNAIPAGTKTYTWIDGERIKCANCTFNAHADWWADQEYRLYEEYKSSERAKNIRNG